MRDGELARRPPVRGSLRRPARAEADGHRAEAEARAAELASANEALRTSRRQLDMVISNAPIILFAFDREGRFTLNEGKGLAVLGRTPGQVVGLSGFEVWRDHPEALHVFRRALAGETVDSLIEVGGASLQAHHSPVRDESGAVVGVIGVALDVTERRRAEERLRLTEREIERLALRDGLTDLPNRTLLRDRLAQAILGARRTGGSVALLLLDLDRFREVNDAFGHEAGDAVLREVAVRLKREVRESDTVARLGGDEFAVAIPDCDRAGAGDLATRVLAAIEPPLRIGPHTVGIGGSIGISMFPDHGDDPEALLRRADVAMYVAKGTDARQAAYSREHDRSTADRLTLASDLRRAIREGSLALHYQPVVRPGRRRPPLDGEALFPDSASPGHAGAADLLCVEALARWHHPVRGDVPPAEFIPLAERIGLMKALTEWVLTTALAASRAWTAVGLEAPVSVNISMRNLIDPDLPGLIGRLLERSGVEPARLMLEITESVLMADPERALATLERLRLMGVRVSVDDFGTGYSSLAYLQRFPVDCVKIDRSFISRVTRDEGSAAIVRSTIDLAHGLGLTAVAEGVEDEATWDHLAGLGCDAVQGYLVSRPLPPSDLLRWHTGAAG